MNDPSRTEAGATPQNGANGAGGTPDAANGTQGASDSAARDNGAQPKLTEEMLSSYGTMLGWLFAATTLVVAILAIPTWIIYINNWTPYTLVYVALFGALGGFVSSLSRLYGLQQLPALLLTPGFKAVRNRYVEPAPLV